MTSRRRFYSILALGVVLLAGLLGFGFWPRVSKQRMLLAEAKEQADRVASVRVAEVAYTKGASEIELPADLQAEIETPVYARVEGYLVKRSVDIGWRVKKGQPLAELETPELDQQIAQARATLSQGLASVKQLEAQVMQNRANLKLAETTATRWKELNRQGVSSRQDADEKQASFEVRQAELAAAEATVAASRESVEAARANLRRLEELKSFSKLSAPFDGVITYRHPDVGTLIPAGTNQKEMFRVADISRIRIFVNVPQAYVTSVRPGTPAVVHVEDINRDYQVKVGGIANALDMNSRTMLAVLRVPNDNGPLMPGMFSRVRIKLVDAPPVLAVPADAVISRNEGTMVAVVGQGNVVHYRKIAVARDTGSSVEITSGLRVGEQVVLNPTDEVREGVAVDIRREQKPQAASNAR
jgi:RND family efflux transporter MFP subunit